MLRFSNANNCESYSNSLLHKIISTPMEEYLQFALTNLVDDLYSRDFFRGVSDHLEHVFF